MPSKTGLSSEPDMGGAQILIRSYSYMFLSPMFTAIRTRTFSFVAVISVFLYIPSLQYSSVQSLSRVWLFANPWMGARQASSRSPTPRVHSDSSPSNQWCHPAISFSVVPFSGPKSLSASESFPMSQLFSWDGQSTGVSALVSFLPKKSQDWSPSEWTGWMSLQSKGLSRVFSNTPLTRALISSWGPHLHDPI